MTFSARISESEMPQPFRSMVKNLRYQLERCRYGGVSVTTVQVDTLEELLGAYEALHGTAGEESDATG